MVTSLGLHDENLIRFEMKKPDLVSVELRLPEDAEVNRRYIKGDILCTAVLQKKPTRQIGVVSLNCRDETIYPCLTVSLPECLHRVP